MTKRLVWLALLLLVPAAAAAADDFDIGIAEGGTLALSADRTLPIRVIYTGNDATVTEVKVFASRFTNDQGDWVEVSITTSCGDAKPEDQPVTIALQSAKAGSLCLKANEFHSDAKYTGYLSLSSNKGGVVKRNFSLTRVFSSPAVLSTDRQAFTVNLTRSFWAPFRGWIPHFSKRDPNRRCAKRDGILATVVIQEKSGKYPANGIVVQTDGSLKTTRGFDPAEGLRLQWNGKDWDRPFATAADPGKAQSLAPGAQGEITIYGVDLTPGEYIFPLHFSGAGANNDNSKFALTVDVRASIVWPVATLLFALALSLVTTKMLVGMRRGAALRQRIADLQVSKGTTLPNLPAVVWVDAVLSLAQRLSNRFWLTGADAIDAQVDSVGPTVALLRQARETRETLRTQLSALMFERVTEAMDRSLGELGCEKPDDALATRIKAELDGYDKLIQDSTRPLAFWALVLPTMQSLQTEMNASGAIPPALSNLKQSLDQMLATTPPTWAIMEQAYKSFARLRILWELRNQGQVFTDLTATTPEPPLEECFRRHDDLDWANLRANQGRLSIQLPAPTSGNAIETFAPVTFSVGCDDRTVSESFIFKRKVQYEWTFHLTPANPNTPAEITLTPRTIGPAVAQYLPVAGRLRVGVKLHYGTETIELAEVAGPNVVGSGDFRIWNLFAAAEYISWSIAALVALLTGLGTYYYKATTWGSFQDFLTLFLWGAGMDQGKNFLQTLQQVSGSSQGSGGQSGKSS